MRILILKDNAARRTAMLEHIADSLPMFGVSFFETSDSIITHLKRTALHEIALISLDNDLDPIVVNGRGVDAGDGVAVARFLVEFTATAPTSSASRPPIIIHTTNETAAAEMVELLTDAKWKFSRVTPYGAESWIGEVWISKVRSMIINNVTDRKTILAARE